MNVHRFDLTDDRPSAEVISYARFKHERRIKSMVGQNRLVTCMGDDNKKRNACTAQKHCYDKPCDTE